MSQFNLLPLVAVAVMCPSLLKGRSALRQFLENEGILDKDGTVPVHLIQDPSLKEEIEKITAQVLEELKPTL